MRAFWFRWIDDKGKKGWMGLAVARTPEELFWEIDQHGDPTTCEVLPVKHGSFCVEVNSPMFQEATGESDVETRLRDFTPGEDFFCMQDVKWRKPNWHLSQAYAVLKTPSDEAESPSQSE